MEAAATANVAGGVPVAEITTEVPAAVTSAAGSNSSSETQEQPAPKAKPVDPRLRAWRETVDRNNMQAVYDAKSPLMKAAKRLGDVVLSGAALVILSPVFLGTAIAIVIEDGFPVIYAAPREGQDGKPFKMYKFRSMCKDADAKLAALLAKNEQDGAAFKIKDDPRITKVGKFIRKTSLDELPQLANIFLGQMSIVGPRPIQSTRPFTPYERQRLIARPGLTCFWQVDGRGDRMPWDEWVELDLDYIQAMSIPTDVKLILKTVGVVLHGKGAY